MIRQKIRKRIAELNKRGLKAKETEDKRVMMETLNRLSECEHILKLLKK